MTTKTASKTLSVRLTPEEHLRLEAEAGNQPLSWYVRSKLLGKKASKRKIRGGHVVKDHEALGHVLGLLGATDMASSLSVLAKAAQSGSLPLTPETEKALIAACDLIRDMHKALMRALGFRS